MTTSPAPAAPAALSIRGVAMAALRSLVRSLPITVAFAIGAAVLTWLVNVWLIARRYEGFNAPAGSPVTTQNNLFAGTLFWFLASTIAFSVVGYARTVGWKKFLDDVSKLPEGVLRLVRHDGPAAASHALWGLAVALVLTGVLSPSLSAVVGAGVLLTLPSVFGRVLLAVAARAWIAIGDAVRSGQPVARPSFATATLTGAGAGCAFLLAFFVPSVPVKIVLALVAGGAAFFIGRTVSTGGAAATGAVLVGAGAVVALLVDAIPVLADDGGWVECGSQWGSWIRCQGTTTVLVSAGVGAGASAVGAGVGTGLGGALGGLTAGGADPGWPWDGGGPGFEPPAGRTAGGSSDNPFTIFDTGGPGSLGCQGLPVFAVNTATRNLVVHDTVFGYRGLGPPVRVSATYNSHGELLASSLGPRWRLYYDCDVEQVERAIAVRKGSGQVLRFRSPDGDGPAPPVDGGFDRLYRRGDEWDLVEDASELVLGFTRGPEPNRWLLSSVRDVNGNVVRVTRRPDGGLVSVTDAAGRTTRLDTDASGRLTVIVTPDGRTARFDYDAAGRLARTVDMLGVETVYTYDDEHRLTAIDVDQGRHRTEFGYADDGGLHTVVDPAGSTTTYEVSSDQPGRVTVTDPEGRVTTYTSVAGRTTSVEDATGVAARFTYSEAGHLTDVHDAAGHRHIQPHTTGQPAEETVNGVTTSYTYDANGRLVAERGPNGEFSTERDDRGNAIGLRAPGGRTLTLQRDGHGQVVALVDAEGARATITRDEFGNVVAVTDALGATTRQEFDDHGLRVIAETDGRGNTTRYEYDANGRPTRMTFADGTERRWDYSCCATVATTDGAGRSLRFSRDPLLRVAEETDAAGNTTWFDFDRSGLLAGVHDAMGRETRRRRDAAGRLVSVTDGAGGEFAFEHDAAGLLSAVTDAVGHRTELERDTAGRVVKVSGAGRQLDYTYDDAARVTQVTNSRRQPVTISYRDDDLPVRIASPDGQPVSFDYDHAGALIRMVDASGTTEVQRDALGRPVRVSYSGGDVLEFEYDEAGNLRAIAYPGGLEVRYQYDERNRVQRVEWDGATVDVQRDRAGQPVELRYDNGVTSTFGYDANGAVVSIRHANAAGPFVQLDYQRDPAGNVVAVDGFAPAEVAPEPELTGFGYGPAGELLVAGDERFSYDADGNLVAGSGLSAAFDAENRATEITRDGQTTRLVYDGFGQLVGVDGPGSFRLRRDPAGRPLVKVGAGGLVEACYVWRDNTLVAAVDANGATVFDHHDTTGHVLARTSAGGEVVDAVAHDPFGGRSAGGGLDGHLFTYCGQHGVVTLGGGLFAMGSRIYHAPTGRFIQRDPLGLGGGFNPYIYADANPVSRIDPGGTKGLFEWLDENLPHDRIKNGIQQAFDTFDRYLGDPVRRWTGGLRHPIKVPVQHLERHNRGEQVRVTPGQMKRELGTELQGHAEDLADNVAPPGASGARATFQAARQAADGDYQGMIQTMASQAEPFLEDHGGATGNAMHRIKSGIDKVGKNAERARQGVEIYRTCPLNRSR